MSHLGFGGDLWGRCSRKVDALFTRGPKGFMERDLGGGFVVVRVDENSPLTLEVIDVIARGECGTTKTAPDPLLDWVFNGVRQSGTFGPLPEAPSAERKTWFRWLITYTIHFGINRGGCYALLDKASRKVVAAAITTPPRTVPFNKSGDEMTINLRKAGMQMGPDVLLNPRMKTLGVWMGNMEEGVASTLRGNFLYTSMFATAPEY